MNNIDFFLKKIKNPAIIDTYDNFFSFLLIENILPFEAKYVSVMKKKNFSLVREIVMKSIEIFNEYLGKEIEYQRFVKDYFIDFYQKCLLIHKKEYILTLIDLNEELITQYINNDKNFKRELRSCFSNNKINDEKLEYLIDIIENKLEISNSLIRENQIIIPDVKKHINSRLYKREINFLTNRLKEFIILFAFLEKFLEHNTSNFLINLKNKNKKPLEKLENNEYLYLVVMHEFFSFLSHYSIGVTFFCSPDNFISNINKATSHLKRAIMDLLDGMIVEYNCSHLPEYLKIRTLKLASLGNKNRIGDLIIELQLLFKKCICTKSSFFKELCQELEKLQNINH